MDFIVMIGKAVLLLLTTMTRSLVAVTSPLWTGYATYCGAERLWGNNTLTLMLGLGVGVLTFAIVQYQWKKSLEQPAVIFPTQP